MDVLLIGTDEWDSELSWTPDYRKANDDSQDHMHSFSSLPMSAHHIFKLTNML